MMALSIVSMAYAKEERTEINQVELTIEYDINSDDEIEVDVINLGEGYDVEDFYINNEPDDGEWSKYESPELIIELYADDDFYFKKGSSSYFDFDGDSARLVSYNRHKDKDYMEVMVLLKPINGTISNPTNLTWSENGKASWDEGYGNVSYTVSLHLNNSQKKSYKTNNEYYDFKEDIVNYGVGNYTFKVVAGTKSNGGGTKSEKVTSYDFVVGDEELTLLKRYIEIGKVNSSLDGPGHKAGETDLSPINPSGEKPTENQLNNVILDGPNHSGLAKGWIRDEVGWWYRNNDLTWTKNDWQLINDKWYFFDDRGYMKTGWIYAGNQWYFLDSVNGDMKTGWILVDNDWYYMDPTNGHMRTGYVYVNGKQYYLGADSSDTSHIFGAMYKNEITPNGKIANEDGSLH